MNHIDYDEHKRLGYSNPNPYPEIKVTMPNQYYASILMNDYAGGVSELTAIMQYLYSNFIINGSNINIAKLFENISINEMLHLEILAELINLLGGNPIYEGSYNNVWNGNNVFYSKNIKEQLEYSIKIEKDAINNYINDISIINDPYIKNILKRIILDEEVHIKLFEETLASLSI